MDRDGGRPAEPAGEDPGDEGRASRRSRTASRSGTSINITLIFSLERYKAVVEAYLRGLERLVAARRRPVEGRLGRVLLRLARRHRGRQAARGGRATRPAGQARRSRTRSSPTGTTSRRSPARAGSSSPARARRSSGRLWASTSTKNPAYRDVLYVEELIGPDTVNTMPLETIKAFQDHGEVRGDTVLEGGRRRRAAARRAARGRRRLRRRRRDDRGRGRAEVRRRRSTELIDGIRAKRGALAAA